MTNEIERTGKKLGKSSENGLASTRLVSGVTNDNYVKLGSDFIKASGRSFLITRDVILIDKQEVPATPRQWGAWLAYFLRKKIRCPLMGLKNYYTVPAEWPHEFDAEATVQEDYLAADAFAAKHVPSTDPKRPSPRTKALVPHELMGFTSHAMPTSMMKEPQVYRPYPKLWEVFADDSKALDRLESMLSFQDITEVSKALAQHGRERARQVLMMKYPPPLPKSVMAIIAKTGYKLRFPEDDKRIPTPPEHLEPPAFEMKDAWWCDKEELRKSAERLAKFVPFAQPCDHDGN